MELLDFPSGKKSEPGAFKTFLNKPMNQMTMSDQLLLHAGTLVVSYAVQSSWAVCLFVAQKFLGVRSD